MIRSSSINEHGVKNIQGDQLEVTLKQQQSCKLAKFHDNWVYES